MEIKKRKKSYKLATKLAAATVVINFFWPLAFEIATLMGCPNLICKHAKVWQVEFKNSLNYTHCVKRFVYCFVFQFQIDLFISCRSSSFYFACLSMFIQNLLALLFRVIFSFSFNCGFISNVCFVTVSLTYFFINQFMMFFM